MLCDDLEGWDGGVEGRLKREGIYVSVWLIYVVVQQKIMQHCKAIIFQFKEKERQWASFSGLDSQRCSF